MTKRKPPTPDDMDEEEMFGGPGLTGMEHCTIYDRAIWLDKQFDDPQVAWWIVACEATDNGDLKPLLERLRQCVPAGAFPFVEDLLERLARKGKPGAPRTPLYDRSRADTRMIWACDEVKELVRAGCKVEAAIEQVAKKPFYQTNFQALWNAYKGKRTSTRRQQQRMKPK